MKKGFVKKEKPKMHKHADEYGFAYGMEHPVLADHKNKKTQEAHDRTVLGKFVVFNLEKEKVHEAQVK